MKEYYRSIRVLTTKQPLDFEHEILLFDDGKYYWSRCISNSFGVAKYASFSQGFKDLEEAVINFFKGKCKWSAPLIDNFEMLRNRYKIKDRETAEKELEELKELSDEQERAIKSMDIKKIREMIINK